MFTIPSKIRPTDTKQKKTFNKVAMIAVYMDYIKSQSLVLILCTFLTLVGVKIYQVNNKLDIELKRQDEINKEFYQVKTDVLRIQQWIN